MGTIKPMRRLLLVANPAASGFTGALHRRVTQSAAETYEVVPVWPSSAAETRNVAATAADDGFDVVLAMGGDGVVHHVAQGIAGSRTALGIIPAGTTNVLARILGVPSKPVKAADMLATAEPRPYRVAHLGTESSTAARSSLAMFSAGIGFDASVVGHAEQRPHAKTYFGGIHYAKSALWTLWSRYRSMPANLNVESEFGTVHAATVFIQVHWPYTYFGSIPIRLTKEPVDGITAVVLESVTPKTARQVVTHLMTGRSLEDIDGVHVWPAFKKLTIDADPAAEFQADGELLGTARALDVSEAAEPLMILTPT